MRPDPVATLLACPHFARLSDYVGPWLIYPPAFAALVEYARSIDLAAHVRAGVAAPKAAAPGSGFETVAAKNGKSVAVVKLAGPMMKGSSSFGGASTVAARRAVRQAAADPEVAGIVLAIDSPGGTVAGTQDLADDVRAATRRKPVLAHADDMTASAAYWVASQADEIWANAPTALVGSIGTLLEVTESSGRAERLGTRERVFSTGPLKSIGGDAPITAEQAAHLQDLVEKIQVEFDAGVRRGRRLSAAQLAEVRSGAVFPAAEAQRLGLVNGVRSLGATIEAAASAK